MTCPNHISIGFYAEDLKSQQNFESITSLPYKCVTTIQGLGQVQYLYLSTYLSVLDVLEYLVYGNVKVLVLVLVLDQKVLGTYK